MTVPPGPRLPPLVQAAFVRAAPYGWMRRRWRRHGDVFSSNFPHYGRVVYVADPSEVKRVCTGDPTIFHAGEANERRAARKAEERDDVLSLLIRAHHEDGTSMTDGELRDELLTLLTADTRQPPRASRGHSSDCCEARAHAARDGRSVARDASGRGGADRRAGRAGAGGRRRHGLAAHRPSDRCR